MNSLTSFGPLYRTTDGGLHWSVASERPAVAASCDPGFGIYFMSVTTGWIPLGVCSGDTAPRALVTRDGGVTWSDASLGIQAEGGSGVPVFIDSNHGVVQAAGTFFTTSDGGRTWTRSNVPADYGLWSLQFTDPNRGWAVVSLTNGTYQLFSTSDGGQNWTEVNGTMPAPANYGDAGLSLLFFSSQNGLWATGDALYRTTDGGTTWAEVK
jgi:photosystem II stability/assembly factor-like uncharacterized protein